MDRTGTQQAKGSATHAPARRAWLRSAAGLGLALAARPAAAAGRPRVALGCVLPTSGPHAAAGSAVKQAVEAAVAEHNAQADTRLPDLAVVALDDGGDAARSVALASQLHAEHGIAALLCPHGAAALRQLIPWAQARRVPIVGARSPSDVQRQLDRWTFFTVASSLDEVDVLVRHVHTLGVRTLGVRTLGALFSADIGGTEAWQHLFTATRAAGLKVLRAEALPADVRAAAGAVRAVLGASPEVVVLLAGGSPGVQAARALVEAGFPASRVYAGSVLEAGDVMQALGAPSEGMVFVQVLPAPDDPQDALAAAYRRAVAPVAGLRPTAAGLEGYLAVQVVLRALRGVRGPVSGDSLADALEQTGRFQLGGLALAFDKTQHRGSRHAHLALLSGGRLRR